MENAYTTYEIQIRGDVNKNSMFSSSMKEKKYIF